MKALICLLLVVVGCGDKGPETTAAPADPELAAVDFLANHVFAEPDTLRARFASAVDPADFPLRLLLDGPEQYQFVDVYRARAIDGRVVITALIELEGQPSTFELWLEMERGRWMISGWRGAPQTVDPSRPAPEGGAAVPPDLSPATYRGAPAIREVQVPTAIRLDGDAGVEPENPRVRVRVTPVGFDGTCPERALNRRIKALRRPFARCYVDATGGSRKGRVTVRVTFDGGQRPEAYISETTLLNNDLSDCLIRLTSALPPSVKAGETCEISLPVTFSPR